MLSVLSDKKRKREFGNDAQFINNSKYGANNSKLAPAAFQKSIRYSQVFHNIEEKHFEALNQTEQKKKEQKTTKFVFFLIQKRNRS